MTSHFNALLKRPDARILVEGVSTTIHKIRSKKPKKLVAKKRPKRMTRLYRISLRHPAALAQCCDTCLAMRFLRRVDLIKTGVARRAMKKITYTHTGATKSSHAMLLRDVSVLAECFQHQDSNKVR